MGGIVDRGTAGTAGDGSAGGDVGVMGAVGTVPPVADPGAALLVRWTHMTSPSEVTLTAVPLGCQSTSLVLHRPCRATTISSDPRSRRVTSTSGPTRKPSPDFTIWPRRASKTMAVFSRTRATCMRISLRACTGLATAPERRRPDATTRAARIRFTETPRGCQQSPYFFGESVRTLELFLTAPAMRLTADEHEMTHSGCRAPARPHSWCSAELSGVRHETATLP